MRGRGGGVSGEAGGSGSSVWGGIPSVSLSPPGAGEGAGDSCGDGSLGGGGVRVSGEDVGTGLYVGVDFVGVGPLAGWSKREKRVKGDLDDRRMSYRMFCALPLRDEAFGCDWLRGSCTCPGKPVVASFSSACSTNRPTLVLLQLS